MYATQLHHGIYPWNEPQRRLQDKDDSSGVYYGCDSKVQIAICLGCERTECVNCLEKKRGLTTRRTIATFQARNERKRSAGSWRSSGSCTAVIYRQPRSWTPCRSAIRPIAGTKRLSLQNQGALPLRECLPDFTRGCRSDFNIELE